MKVGDEVFVAPSGVQKERIQPDDLFILDAKMQVTCRPPSEAKLDKPFKESECTPLFFNAFSMRGAGACMHTHSPNAVMATILFGDEFRISHIEMIKGIVDAETKQAHMFNDTLVVPIIDNTNFERDLTASMAEAMLKYPKTNCVLVRRHGCYVWGESWQKCKAMCECYDYLFGMAIEMKRHGVPTVTPSS